MKRMCVMLYCTALLYLKAIAARYTKLETRTNLYRCQVNTTNRSHVSLSPVSLSRYVHIRHNVPLCRLQYARRPAFQPSDRCVATPREIVQPRCISNMPRYLVLLNYSRMAYNDIGGFPLFCRAPSLLFCCLTPTLKFSLKQDIQLSCI
jgi:hypothetical protein